MKTSYKKAWLSDSVGIVSPHLDAAVESLTITVKRYLLITLNEHPEVTAKSPTHHGS